VPSRRYDDGVITLAGHSYARNTACIACSHVLDGAPILVVVLDQDGELQFLCGSDHRTSDARVVALDEVVGVDLGLDDLPELVTGTQATRPRVATAWEIAPLE
jgi:hypothetical protein